MPMTQKVKNEIVDRLDSFVYQLNKVKSNVISNDYENGLSVLGATFEQIDQLGMMLNIATAQARQKEQKVLDELSNLGQEIQPEGYVVNRTNLNAISVVTETGTFDAQVAKALEDDDKKN